MTGTLSVIIPVYNRAAMVGETIQNMLNQSLKPLEIIVVDDGSTDDSASVAESFGGIVRVIRQANQGPGAARNAGLKAAKGEFIQFMDSDDLASLNKFELQVEALQRSGADFAYCPWMRCRIYWRFIWFDKKLLQSLAVPPSRSMLEWFASGWSLVFQNCLFRRSILDKAGAYRTDLICCEDSEYFIRILLAGAEPVFTPSCMIFYREHELHKLTSSDAGSDRRALDWTKFLTIAGDLLRSRLKQFRPLTRLAIAAHVKAHLDYCRKHGFPLLPNDNPYTKLVSSAPAALVQAYTLTIRMRRKLLQTPHQHKAFHAKKPDQTYESLVRAMGYQLV